MKTSIVQGRNFFRSIIWTAMILGLGLAPAILAADTQTAKKQFPLEAAFINHAVTPLFGGTILDILHPGFTLGTEFVWKDGRLGALVPGIRAGYYYNQYDSRAVFIQASLTYRYTLGFGLFAEIAPVLGYMRRYHPGDIWRLNAEGEYEKAKDGGVGELMISGSLGLGFDFGRKLGWPVAVFVRYQPFVMAPDTPAEGVLSQAFLQGGIRIHIW